MHTVEVKDDDWYFGGYWGYWSIGTGGCCLNVRVTLKVIKVRYYFHSRTFWHFGSKVSKVK